MNRRSTCLAGLALAALLTFPLAAETTRRPLKVDDIFALKTVGDPQISPDGNWVAYTVRSLDPKEDSSDTDIYMVPFAGGTPLRLTSSPKAESHPRFSPDGRYLAFLSGREGKKAQVWLLDRRGGEAVKLTDLKSSVSDFAWSPDGKRLALAVGDIDPDDHGRRGQGGRGPGEEAEDAEADRHPPSAVHARRRGLSCATSASTSTSSTSPASRASRSPPAPTTTPSPSGPPTAAGSPSPATAPPIRTPTTTATSSSSRPRRGRSRGRSPPSAVTDREPAFSPDGKWIAYVAGGDPKDIWYASNHVAVVPAAGGEPRALTAQLDRNVESPRFSPDGRFVYFLAWRRGATSTSPASRPPAARSSAWWTASARRAPSRSAATARSWSLESTP